ncbi:MAG: hypothetical protein HGA38_00415 [Candidatus Moranbacteria bacterium]|nr:hypothetical protein [Candidatus Moranbacteria bacterium]
MTGCPWWAVLFDNIINNREGGVMTIERKKGPYIGWTNANWTPELVRRALELVPETSRYRLMVGLPMGPTVFDGDARLWGAVKNLCVRDPRLFVLIHYGTSRPESLNNDLQALIVKSGQSPGPDGFQLNIPWPPLDELEKFRERHPEKHLVLQIGRQALSDLGNFGGLMERVAGKLRDYEPFIDAVLFDPSGGTGTPFNPKMAHDFLWKVRDCYPGLGFGVAGGLGADVESEAEARKLLRSYSGLSLDAEYRVKKPEDGFRYLKAMFGLVSR